MKAKILGILCLFATATALVSCTDAQVFPDEPFLEYRGYELVTADADTALPVDHAVVELYFTDGDGDIGEDIPDGEFNFHVGVHEKFDTGYVFAYNWSGILKDLSDPGQQNKALKGIIYYKVALSEVETDTVRIDFELVDDTGNTSGIIPTEDIFVDFP